MWYYTVQRIIILMSGKSFRIEERLKTQSGEENSSSGRFNPVGRLQQYILLICLQMLTGSLGKMPSLDYYCYDIKD